MTQHLIHRTLETSHERRSPLAEVEPDILEGLRPLLVESVKHSRRVHVGADWWIEATVDQGRLRFRLAVAADGPALVDCRVTRGVGSVQPLLVVSVAALLRGAADGEVSTEQVAMADDLERCVAWAWLVGVKATKGD